MIAAKPIGESITDHRTNQAYSQSLNLLEKLQTWYNVFFFKK